MTTETFTPAQLMTIAGTGPYAVPFEYGAGDLVVQVFDGDTTIDLVAADYSLSPTEGTSGNLTLSASAASTHAGLQLSIRRSTDAVQGWTGQGGAREQGLEDQLDRLTRGLQDAQQNLGRVVKMRAGTLDDFPAPVDGRVIIGTATGYTAGPAGDEIAQAQARAQAAQTAQTAAEAALAQTQVVLGTLEVGYLGAKTVAPTLDNEGNALQVGASYFLMTGAEAGRYYWNGTEWVSYTDGSEQPLRRANNLSDLTNADTALDNLGLSATGIAVGKAADQAAGRAALGLLTAATRAVGTAAGNVPLLDGDGKLPSQVMPGGPGSHVAGCFTTVTAGVPAMSNDTGFASVSSSTSGIYRYTFSTARASDKDYHVDVALQFGSNDNRFHWTVYSRTTTYFDIKITNVVLGAGPIDHSVMVRSLV